MSDGDRSLGDPSTSRSLEITQNGRGGGMTYHEGEQKHSLSWEFALEPAIVLIFGTTSAQWDVQNPWSAGRQEAIYTFIGEEVVRQKVPSGDFDLDLEAGVVTILRTKRRRAVAAAQRAEASRTASPDGSEPNDGTPGTVRAPAGAAWKRFTDSIATAVTGSNASLGYDLDAVALLSDLERDDAVDLLVRRGEPGWREIQTLGAIDTPASTAQLARALGPRSSVRSRLIAARALHARGHFAESSEYERVVVKSLRALHNEKDGLSEALAIAETLDSNRVRQALLYAAYQQTRCASPCAQLLLTLTGEWRDDAETRDMLSALGEQNSYFDRKRAFDSLCARVGIVFDPDDDTD